MLPFSLELLLVHPLTFFVVFLEVEGHRAGKSLTTHAKEGKYGRSVLCSPSRKDGQKRDRESRTGGRGVVGGDVRGEKTFRRAR